MFTDIVGYSRMIGSDEKNALKFLDDQNSINTKNFLFFHIYLNC